MYSSTATLAPRHRGRTRLWEAPLRPRRPMRPDGPKDPLSELFEHLLHPVQGMRRLVGRGRDWSQMPWGLWWLLALIAVAGSAIYGATLTLVLPAGGWWFSAAALTLSATAGWALLFPVLAGVTRRPAPHLAHACLVTTLFGEGVLEIGAIANLTMWWLADPSPAFALAFNIALVAVSNLVMLAVLTAQLRVIRIRPALSAALWFGILNLAGLAAFRIFYPGLFPF